MSQPPGTIRRAEADRTASRSHSHGNSDSDLPRNMYMGLAPDLFRGFTSQNRWIPDWPEDDEPKTYVEEIINAFFRSPGSLGRFMAPTVVLGVQFEVPVRATVEEVIQMRYVALSLTGDGTGFHRCSRTPIVVRVLAQDPNSVVVYLKEYFADDASGRPRRVGWLLHLDSPTRLVRGIRFFAVDETYVHSTYQRGILHLLRLREPATLPRAISNGRRDSEFIGREVDECLERLAAMQVGGPPESNGGHMS